VDYPQATPPQATAPVAENDGVIGISGQPVTISVLDNDSDPDNDLNPATVKIVGTANAGDPFVIVNEGTWSINPSTGAITFTPFAGFTDNPSPISYTIKDHTGLESNLARVNISYPAPLRNLTSLAQYQYNSLSYPADSISKYIEKDKK
jgi:CshA-type fibril repeat protein